MPTISFLTDFGLDDEYVGVCHGVMRRILPGLEIVDITHGIRPQAVLEGALALRRAAPYLPDGIVLAVVDPGVGSGRLGVALRSADGRVYVGPDNGVLTLAADVTEARSLTNERYHLEIVSRTFHARDVFAPVAAHLAAGADFRDLGDELDAAELIRLEVPNGTVLAADRFGNLALTRADLDGAHRVTIECIGEVRVASTYAEVAEGELLLLESSSGELELAVRNGSAAALTGLAPGDRVRLSAAP